MGGGLGGTIPAPNGALIMQVSLVVGLDIAIVGLTNLYIA